MNIITHVPSSHRARYDDYETPTTSLSKYGPLCPSVRPSVCPRTYLANHTSKLHQIFSDCCPRPWIGRVLAARQYVTYFRFCGLRRRRVRPSVRSFVGRMNGRHVRRPTTMYVNIGLRWTRDDDAAKNRRIVWAGVTTLSALQWSVAVGRIQFSERAAADRPTGRPAGLLQSSHTHDRTVRHSGDFISVLRRDDVDAASRRFCAL